jgi:hypothetical protein
MGEAGETAREAKDGFVAIGAAIRPVACSRPGPAQIVEPAGAGDLPVPLARAFAVEDARGAAAHARRTAPEREAGAGAPRVMSRPPRYEAGLLASGWTAWSWRANCLSSA